ncbi:MAG: multidrug efflux RND transporter permease subunit [Betaproteobacteria bacterium]|jgi:multidrug efflux pump
MFSRFFIERPIFAAVVSILLCLTGVAAMLVLPVQQYPNVTPVQITVNATYPGADSRTLADSVAAPIEAQINGVDNMLYMSSTSSATGQLTLTVYFSLDTDPDAAQVQVQNRVNLALPQLPSAVTQLGVSVQKKSSSIMMLVAITGKTGRYSDEYIANYANVYVLDAIKRVPGAGQASIMGVPDQAMRLWMNPERMASLGITTTDIQQAVAGQNALFGAGQLGQAPNAGRTELTVPVITQRPGTEPAQYENIILRASQDGSAIVRLKDVARAEVGLRQYVIDSRFNGAPATFIAVYQQPGANGLKVADAVRDALAELKSRFPEGVDYAIALDTTEFVRIAIEEVLHTLLEAVVLVVLIVYLFLQSLRTTLICLVAIVVSLVATFAGMLAFGFSINLLTLFGLVLAIGLVVDDAIVVVENVERIMTEHHLPAREATVRAMGEITGALVAVVLVMAAVFVPAAFLPGTTGQIYQQFAVTLVISVAVSGLVALTLTPAMCALWLRHDGPKTRGVFGWFNRKVDRFTELFGQAVVILIRRLAVAGVLLVVLIYGIVHLARTLPTGFVPNEDQGYVMAAVLMPGGASLDRTRDTAARVDALFAKDPAVLDRTQLSGFSLIDGGFKTNAATLFVTLRDFRERYASVETALAQNPRSVLRKVYAGSASIPDGMVIPVAPPPIPGIGSTGGFEFWIQDTGAGDPARLEEAVQKFIARARERPELAGLNSTFKASVRQLRVTVDRDKALLLGVPVQDVYGAIQAQFGSLAVSQFNQYSRVWQVILQSDPLFRRQPDDIARLYTRSQQGAMVPLSALVRTEWVSGPDVLPRFNGFPAAKINGTPAADYSSGQAIAALEETAREVLPSGFTTAWSGLAFEEKKSGGASTVAFALGLLVVFLVLAAQYESWRLPLAVMTAIPFGVLGALAANHLRGLQNDVYFQIGLLVLIGLGAKNAILRVTAAVDLRRQGRTIMQATIEAGEQRLRPIIMTSLAFGVGVLPLVLAMGAGANARHSIGTGILGGMIGETTLAMLYVPIFFYLLERFAERRGRGAPAASGDSSAQDSQPEAGATGSGVQETP